MTQRAERVGSEGLRLVVHGARGSMSVSGVQYVRYGGNTTSFHIDLGDNEHVVIDAGTGLRSLEHSLGPGPHRLTVFLTHYHWDHIQGLPLCSLLHDPSTTFRFVGGTHGGEDVQSALEGAIRHPWFPVSMADCRSTVEYSPVEDKVDVGPLTVRSIPLTHPQDVTGYRIEGPRRTVVIATDHEAGDTDVDEGLAAFAEGAEVLIHDGQYGDAEYAIKTGWGHSTPDAAVDAAIAAGARRLILTSHDPDHSDEEIDALVTTARIRFPLTSGAFEGMAIDL